MKKLLVVEDEPNLRDGIVTAFRDDGWEVSQACDGAEAIQMLESEVFDVLVTDWAWAPDLGLSRGGSCPPFPTSNLPSGQELE